MWIVERKRVFYILRRLIITPESKEHALKRAKEEGFPVESVRKGKKGYYITPHGITDVDAKNAYVARRDAGDSKEKSAKIAWHVQKMKEGK